MPFRSEGAHPTLAQPPASRLRRVGASGLQHSSPRRGPARPGHQSGGRARATHPPPRRHPRPCAEDLWTPWCKHALGVVASLRSRPRRPGPAL